MREVNSPKSLYLKLVRLHMYYLLLLIIQEGAVRENYHVKYYFQVSLNLEVLL